MPRMSKPTLELVLHPVRLRILNAMSGDRTGTTTELSDRMPDLSQATLYRHVKLLLKGGLLEVVDEQQVRGAIERRYRVRREVARIGMDTAAAMSLQDHRTGFTATMAALIAEFNTYLDRKGANPFADKVSYRQATLWLRDEDLDELLDEIRTVIVSRIQKKPARGSKPYRANVILFPAE